MTMNMPQEVLGYFSNTVAKDFLLTMCGTHLGSGMFREVFESSLSKDFVIKIETGAGDFANVMEWETWCRVMDTKWSKWFAPCEYISPCGTVLVMCRTWPLKSHPERVPSFFTDVKRDNWGQFRGRPVCHDYAMHLLMERGMSDRMRKARWDDREY